jgi:Bacterial Ig domain
VPIVCSNAPVIASATGNYTCTLIVTLIAGTTVSATATDLAGNISTPATVVVSGVSATVSVAPVINPINNEDLFVTGTGVDGATITLTNASCLNDPVIVVGGVWTCNILSGLAVGTIVGAEQTEVGKTISAQETTTVSDSDTTAPSAPILNPTNGSSISGKGEPGATVTVKNSAGTIVCIATVQIDATWSCIPTIILLHGAVLTATQRDASGNISGPATVIVVNPSAIIVSSGGGGGGGGSIIPAISKIINPVANPKPDLIGGGEPNVPEEFSPYVCKRYLRSYIYPNKKNIIEDVKNLQLFLNETQLEKLVVDGIYKDEDILAVKRYQTKYFDQIMSPWGAKVASGIVFKTTTAKINLMSCQGERKTPYFTEYLKVGDDSLEVVRLQDYLNIIFAPISGYPNNGLQLSKKFDSKTAKKLKEFQSVYKETVLKPWGLKSPTGWFYKTTRKSANLLTGYEEKE